MRREIQITPSRRNSFQKNIVIRRRRGGREIVREGGEACEKELKLVGGEFSGGGFEVLKERGDDRRLCFGFGNHGIEVDFTKDLVLKKKKKKYYYIQKKKMKKNKTRTKFKKKIKPYVCS